jgi:cell wall-associated NlpC family hydrolase
MSGIELNWSAGYVGTVYSDKDNGAAGCHCWGLLRLVFRQEKGIELPDFETVSPDDVDEIAALIHGAVDLGLWRRVDRPQAFDGALFRRGRHDSHVGVMIDRRHMLHSDREAGAAIVERIDAGRWASSFVGFYRHKDLI